MTINRKDFGFWRNLNRMNIGEFSGIEAPIALVIGTGGCTALILTSNVEERTSVAGDFLTLIASLLGVVFAAFALVISLLSDKYLLYLQRHPDGAMVFLRPFMINIGLQVGAIIGAIAYRSVAPHLPITVERVYFVILGTLFTFALLNITALARNVLAHGATRAEVAELEDLERQVERLEEYKRQQREGD